MIKHSRRRCGKPLNIGEISKVIPLFQILVHMVSAHPRQYGDSRTWHQRLVQKQLNWQPLLPSLTQAYLRWKYPQVASSPGTPTTCQDEGLSTEPISYDFDITTIDLYTLASSMYIPRTASMTAPEALMLQGYMATSPISPSLAISIKTLELFRILRSRKASLSVEAYAKALCDLYGVSSCLLTSMYTKCYVGALPSP